MHDIEPYYHWRDYYDAARDKRSPFYGRRYSELYFTHCIYNYYIHPQWDSFGSSTLYCKILYADYVKQFVVIELIGEWNDTLHNDIMEMKRGLINPLIDEGIRKFILIGENVLNFHASDELYYEEWYEEIKEDGGYIVALNFREHVIREMCNTRIHHFMHIGNAYNDVLWRKVKPFYLHKLVDALIMRSLE
ncbi:MAG: hypothetical protein NZM35_02480 [Chitinophagales bacterium]|nr:hypothetical protein [Chitinophagales bacterium]MDW8417926.1 hypothetical protein [Chitinophagales bacterium]